MRKLDACVSNTYDEFIQILASRNSSSFSKRVLGMVLGLIGLRRFKSNCGFSISFQFYRMSGKRLDMDFQCFQIQPDLKKCDKNRFHHTLIPIPILLQAWSRQLDQNSTSANHLFQVFRTND